MRQIVQYGSTPRPAPQRNRHATEIDAIEASRLARQADRVEAARGAMLEAIDHIIESTYAQPSHSKKRAKKRLVEAWLAIAEVVQELSKPAPKFRPNVTTFRPIVRHRADLEGVEDLRPVLLPAALVEI